MWANKVRSILTTVGIIIGVASVTAVIAALTGMKQSVLSEFETFGTNKVFILPYPPYTGRRQVWRWRDLRFHAHDFDELLQHCPDVQSYTRNCDFMVAPSRSARAPRPMCRLLESTPPGTKLKTEA